MKCKNLFNIYIKLIQKLKLVNRLVNNICDLKKIFSKRKKIVHSMFEASLALNVVVDIDKLRNTNCSEI